MKPFFSILVPVYNVERYLRRCLDSLIHQTFTDFELILVNDASPDKSQEIMEEYLAKDSRIRIYCHPQNYGMVMARKTGIDLATGKYCVFCDSDDYLDQNYLRKASEYLSDTEYDIVHFATTLIGKKIHSMIKNHYEHRLFPHKTVFNNDCLFQTYFLEGKIRWNLCGNVFRTSLLKQCNFIETPNCSCEDLLRMTVIMYYAKNLLYVHDKVYYYCFENGPSGIPQLSVFQFRQKASAIKIFDILSSFFQQAHLPEQYRKRLDFLKTEYMLETFESLKRLVPDLLLQGHQILMDNWGKENYISIQTHYIANLEEKYELIATSLPWKATYPLRKLYDLCNNIFPSRKRKSFQ